MIPADGQNPRPMRCSVVVTTWRRPALLRNTIASVLDQTYPHLEVVIVCDGDDAGTRAVCRDFAHEPGVRWVFHPVNRGLPAARNTGAREACGDVVLFLDDDVIAESDLVGAHMEHHLQAAPGRRIAVTSLAAEDRHTRLSTYLNERLHDHWKSMLDYLSEILSDPGPDSIGDPLQQVIGFGLNCSIRRDLFLARGGFNEVFRASDEDAEMGIRLYLEGFHFIFEPRRLLTHKNSKDLTAYFRGCWRASGSLDLFRVAELGQKNAQTRHLVSMYHGYFLNRLAAKAAWHSSRFVLKVSRLAEQQANRLRSPLLFSIWSKTVRAGEYWSSVKSDGCSLAHLKKAAGVSRRAIAFHSLSGSTSDAEASQSISPPRFARMMRRLVSAGYRTATTTEWLSDELAGERVLITFEDGHEDVYEHFLPLAIERHLTAVIFLVVNRVAGSNLRNQKSGQRARNLLTWPQIREMQKYGIEFGSNTLSHPFLPDVSEEQLRCEVADSKRRLEDALGCEVRSFAYPYGGVDRRVRAAVADAGYQLAFTTLPGPNWWNDPLCQHRAEVNEHTSLLDFMYELRTGYDFAQSISERVGAFERDLPSQALRNAAGALRSFGHSVQHNFKWNSKRVRRQ